MNDFHRPRISVVTVCRNSCATISEAVESLRSQTYPEIEHIVIDGASTDGTVEVLHRYDKGIAKLVSEPDQGVYDAMNKGLRWATGKYVGFLNADDVYAHEEVISRLVSAIETAGCDAGYGDLVYVDQHDTERVVRYWRSCNYVPGLVEQGWMPAHPTFYVKTSILMEIGGFDPRYRYHADYELMLRLFSKQRISTVYIPEILVRMRTGGQSNRSFANIVKGNLESYAAAKEAGVARTPLWIARKLWLRVPQLLNRPKG